MELPGVHVATVHAVHRYSWRQKRLACLIAAVLGRGQLLLCEPPELVPLTDDER